MTDSISNSDDVIDSRDVIARIEELRDERDSLKTDREEVTHDDPEGYNAAVQALQDWENDYGPELAALEALQTEAEGCAPDWRYGAMLIRDSYFKNYAMELADDIGAIPRDLSWPATCIDWDQAAKELRMDYASVDFDGVDYWVR